jgi:cytochrome c-type biogenesis protein CcmH
LSRVLRAFLLFLVVAAPALAVTPQERLADPALEARARAISQELRCVVCQNQSIDDSNADLAHDLRVIVRERLKAGDSDAQAIDWIVARYGDFVLLRPPVEPATWPMWFAPPVVLALGAVGIAVYFRRRRGTAAPQAPLSPDERRRLEGMLGDG